MFFFCKLCSKHFSVLQLFSDISGCTQKRILFFVYCFRYCCRILVKLCFIIFWQSKLTFSNVRLTTWIKKALLKLYSLLLTICTTCFNNNKLCVSLTECINLFCVNLAINSWFYSLSLIGWSL